MLTFFAHDGATHTTSAQATMHYLQEWYIALPLLVFSITSVATLLYFASKKSKPVTFLGVIALLLVAGLAGYNFSTITSVVSLSLGLGLIFFSVLVSLMAPGKK